MLPKYYGLHRENLNFGNIFCDDRRKFCRPVRYCLLLFDSFIHEPRHYQVNHCYSSSFPADASRRSHLRSHVTAWFQFYFHNFNSKSMAMLVFQNRMKGIISLVESAELGWWTNHIKCYLNLGSKFMIWWRKDIVFRKQNIYHILPMKTGIKVAFYLLK